jgi:hypothetical protein
MTPGDPRSGIRVPEVSKRFAMPVCDNRLLYKAALGRAAGAPIEALGVPGGGWPGDVRDCPERT